MQNIKNLLKRTTVLLMIGLVTSKDSVSLTTPEKMSGNVYCDFLEQPNFNGNFYSSDIGFSKTCVDGHTKSPVFSNKNLSLICYNDSKCGLFICFFDGLCDASKVCKFIMPKGNLQITDLAQLNYTDVKPPKMNNPIVSESISSWEVQLVDIYCFP